jgi:hypothetical protein
MGSWSDWLAVCGVPLGFALPCGVKLTALGLDEGAGSERLWIGLPLLAAGVVGVECLRRCVGLVAAEPVRLGIRRDKARLVLRDVRALQVAALVLLPVAAVLQFALLLDGHVHLRACGWLFVLYGIGAVAVCAGRRASTRWGSCYLRWGWAPLVAFGVPLGLPVLLVTGLVSPVIPPG